LLLSEPGFLTGNLVLIKEVVFEGGKGALPTSILYSLHQPGDEAQVVDSG